MMIVFRGRGDKRPLVIPLLHCLNQIGGALLLSDDAGYRNLLPGTGRAGFLGNVRVYAHADFSKESLQKYEAVPENFRYVVCDRVGGKVNRWDYAVLVVRDGETAPIPKVNQQVVQLGFIPPKDRCLFVPITLPLMKSIYEQECRSRFAPIRDKAAVKALSSLYSDMLDIKPTALRKLLTKGGEPS